MEPYGNYIINQSSRVIGVRNGVRVPGAGYGFGFDHTRGLMHHMAPRYPGPRYFQTRIEMDPNDRFVAPGTELEIYHRTYNRNWPGAETAVDLWLDVDDGRFETFTLATGASLVVVNSTRWPGAVDIRYIRRHMSGGHTVTESGFLTTIYPDRRD